MPTCLQIWMMYHSRPQLFSLREFPRHASLDAKVKGHHNIVDFDEMLIRAITQAITKLGQIFWILSKSRQPRVSFSQTLAGAQILKWDIERNIPRIPRTVTTCAVNIIFGHFCRWYQDEALLDSSLHAPHTWGRPIERGGHAGKLPSLGIVPNGFQLLDSNYWTQNLNANTRSQPIERGSYAGGPSLCCSSAQWFVYFV